MFTDLAEHMAEVFGDGGLGDTRVYVDDFYRSVGFSVRVDPRAYFDSWTKDEVRDAWRKWAAFNRGERKAYNKEWKVRNKDKVRASRKRYYERNKARLNTKRVEQQRARRSAVRAVRAVHSEVD